MFAVKRMPRSALAIRHIAFEGLGLFAEPLRAAGCSVRTIDAQGDELRDVDPLAADPMIVLGGPMGVYDADRLPFLARELDLIERRIAAGRPTLGIAWAHS